LIAVSTKARFSSTTTISVSPSGKALDDLGVERR
jgi:hypothetical protein